MGRLDNLPDNMEPEDLKTTEILLRSMTNELRNLQQDLVTQLHQDVRRLQAEKSRLINDIEKLQNQQQLLQSQSEITLSRQQLAQQQAWAKQLALALANHLHSALTQRLSQTLSTYPMPTRTVEVPQLPVTQPDAENTYRLLASIDETLNRTFTSLHHDLNSYQSAVSQQLGRMHDLGQQGEAILEVLVGRISQQLQAEMLKNRVDRTEASGSGVSAPPGGIATPPVSPSAEPGINPALRPPLTDNPPYAAAPYPPTAYAPSAYPPNSYPPSDAPPPLTPPPAPAANAAPPLVPPAPLPSPAVSGGNIAPPVMLPADELEEDLEASLPARPATARRSPPFQLGVVLILFSTLTLALHHAVVQVIGTPGKLFGSEALALGGVISLKTFSGSLLLFWVRIIAIVPLMALVSGVLYPPVWRDVRALFALRDRRWLWSLVGSGIFLLLSQVFLYIAISETTPAIAVALSSTYPIAMLPLTWLLFGDRPPRLRVVGLLILIVGLGFTVFAAPIALSNEGLVAALLSGVMLALYLVSMMIINRRKVNPVPITLIQNATMFVLSSLFLIGVRTQAAPIDWTGLPGLLLSGLILGSLTIVSYALNDFGSRLLGAARATIIAASVPVLTALLAFIILPAANSLSLGQIIGIFVVTLGTVALSLERILSQYKAMRRSKANSIP